VWIHVAFEGGGVFGVVEQRQLVGAHSQLVEEEWSLFVAFDCVWLVVHWWISRRVSWMRRASHCFSA
jgi:hypothetical protein